MLVVSLGWPVLAGVALGIIALTKPTSCVATACLGVAWVALIHTQRPLTSLVVAASVGVSLVLAGALLIDGNLVAFLHRNLGAFSYMRALDSGADMHGIATSVLHPFWSDTRWRIWPALGVGMLMLALAAEVLAAGRIHQTPAWLPAAAVLALFGAVVAFSRALDPCCAEGWPGFRAWNFPALLVACAVGLATLWDKSHPAPLFRRTLRACALLAAAPFAYSIGTNITIIFHMSGASVFWAAAALLLAALDPDGGLSRLRTVSLLCCVATLAMLAGMSTNPGRIGLPLWQQTELVAIGPDRAVLLLDPETADYFRALQASATSNGFVPGTPIVDLSGDGPGAAFAIGGEALSLPWLLANGPNPAAANRVALSRVPRDVLSRAWILTGPPEHLMRAKATLGPLGVPFPSGHRLLVELHHARQDWIQTLWRPDTKRRAPASGNRP